MNRDAKIGVVVVLVIIALFIVIWKIRDNANNEPKNLPADKVVDNSNTGNTGGTASPLSILPIVPVPTRAAAVTESGAVTTGAPTEYKIKDRDTLTKIGKAFGVSVDALKAANPTIDPNNLKVNSTIKIPAPTTSAVPVTTGGAPVAEPTRPAPTHVEPPVVIEDPTRLEPTVPPDAVVPDSGSTAPDSTAAPATTPAAGGKYTVQRGDTLSKIVREHMGITDPTKVAKAVADIVKLNSLANPNAIEVGQELTLP